MTVDSFCTSCGRPRAADARSCTGCGESFGTPGPPVVAAVPAAATLRHDAPANFAVTSQAADGAPRYGTFVQRVAAYLIDVVLITLVAGALGGARTIATVPLLAAIYFVGFWGSTGRTFGMLVLGIRVTTIEGRSVGYAHALIRYLGLLVALVVLLLGVLLILIDPRRQGLHDKIAGTIVVRV